MRAPSCLLGRLLLLFAGADFCAEDVVASQRCLCTSDAATDFSSSCSAWAFRARPKPAWRRAVRRWIGWLLLLRLLRGVFLAAAAAARAEEERLFPAGPCEGSFY